MITPIQVILVCLWRFFLGCQGGLQLFVYASHVLTGGVVGAIMGNMKAGLEVGATLTLMSLGVGGFGGSSVPDYALGTVLGTIFSITTGNGLEAALTIAIPVAALGTNLDIMQKTLGSFFIHREIAESEAGRFDQMGKWVHSHIFIADFLVSVLPVLLVMTIGEEFVTGLITALPAWFNKGMSAVGGILPAVGFGMLLKYLPLKTYWPFLILGFLLASYLNLAMLPIALIALIFAWMEFRSLEKESELAKAAVTGVTAEDIAAGVYDE